MRDDELNDIPDALRDALRREYPAPRVPAAIDEAILGGARAYLRRRPPRYWRLFGGVAAAAAVTVITSVSIHVARQDRAPVNQPVAGIVDLNRDGTFNILDALAAAKGGAPQQDVDRLAAAVVRVEVVQ